MKAKKIFEKFIEDSDPIDDMGIGIYNRLKNPKLFKSREEYIKALVTVLPHILGTDGIPRDILGIDHAISWPYYYKIVKFLDNLPPYERHNLWLGTAEYLKSLGFKEIGKYTRENTASKYLLNEKFTEDSDPITDMGIGLLSIYQNLKKGDILQLKRSINFDPVESYKKGAYIILLSDIKFDKHDLPYKDRIEYSCVKRDDIKKILNGELSYSDLYDTGWYINFQFFKETFRKVNINEFK